MSGSSGQQGGANTPSQQPVQQQGQSPQQQQGSKTIYKDWASI